MMMGSVPSAQALSDLALLLQLLEAAKDTKRSKEAIDVLRAERQAYDDAIKEAGERTAAAAAAEARAAQVVAEAERIHIAAQRAKEAADEELRRANLVATEADEKRLLAANELQAAAILKAQNEAQQVEAVRLKNNARDALAEAREGASKIIAEAHAVMADAQAKQAEAEARLAKLKALIEE